MITETAVYCTLIGALAGTVYGLLMLCRRLIATGARDAARVRYYRKRAGRLQRLLDAERARRWDIVRTWPTGVADRDVDERWLAQGQAELDALIRAVEESGR